MNAGKKMTYGELEFYFDSLTNLKELMKSRNTDMVAIQDATDQLRKDGSVYGYEMADVIKYVEKTRRK